MPQHAPDGAIPASYDLVESKSADYVARTEASVIDSHCTVVFTSGKPLGGSKKSVAFAEKHRRPCLCVNLDAMSDKWAAAAILQWLRVHLCRHEHKHHRSTRHVADWNVVVRFAAGIR